MDGLRAFELRLTRPDGATKHILVTTTRQEACTLVQRFLDYGQAARAGLRVPETPELMAGIRTQPTQS